MGLEFIYPELKVARDETGYTHYCICEQQCVNEVHYFDEEESMMKRDDMNCVNYQRYVSFCPTRALKIVETNRTLRESTSWQNDIIREICKQANNGGVLLSSMDNLKPFPVFRDNILMSASQVTNPSIDPLREPMRIRVYLGKKPEKIKRLSDDKLSRRLPSQLELSMPLLFSVMSCGSISYNAHKLLALTAAEPDILYNTGEGGLHEDFYYYGEHTIVQMTPRHFDVHGRFLNTGITIEIKMRQSTKPGIDGHLPGAKIIGNVSRIRMTSEGSDTIFPAPHHDIYSVEDLRQLVLSLKEATAYKKLITVKAAAMRNIVAIIGGVAHSGADIIVIDGLRGGTGAAPTRIRDSVSIPIELALAAVDQRLRDEGIRSNVSLAAGGNIQSAADVVKVIALGADVCYIAIAALLALGCHLYRTCRGGKCSWETAAQNPDLVRRLGLEIGSERLVSVMEIWQHETEELMGGVGINSIEALRGNRLMLRGIDPNEKRLETLGISYAGEQTVYLDSNREMIHLLTSISRH